MSDPISKVYVVKAVAPQIDSESNFITGIEGVFTTLDAAKTYCESGAGIYANRYDGRLVWTSVGVDETYWWRGTFKGGKGEPAYFIEPCPLWGRGARMNTQGDEKLMGKVIRILGSVQQVWESESALHISVDKPEFKAGDEVEVLYKRTGRWHRARVKSVMLAMDFAVDSDDIYAHGYGWGYSCAVEDKNIKTRWITAYSSRGDGSIRALTSEAHE